MIKLFRPKYKNRFTRVVYDEDHRVKNKVIISHFSVKALLAPHVQIITATLLINKTSNLLKYLELFWKKEYKLENIKWDYDTALKAYRRAPLEINGDYYFLDPRYFAALIRYGEIDVYAASIVLSRILYRI